jgi:hypothetical protein
MPNWVESMKVDRWARPVTGWLRSGGKAGWRRSVLAYCLAILRTSTTAFYTVQNQADVHRLRTTGFPWPAGDLRAHFGPGVYAWRGRRDARDYRELKQSRGIADLQIVRFHVANRRLQRFRQLDVDRLPDPGAWLRRYSLLWEEKAEPHGFHYIRRGVGFRAGGQPAVEHYFHRSVFRYLWFC